MPGGDRTGPLGMGPRTGRALGFCSGSGEPGYANGMPGGRCGWNQGRAGGRGRRHWFYATGLPRWARFPENARAAGQDQADEKQRLLHEAAALEAQWNAIKKRMEALEASSSANQ